MALDKDKLYDTLYDLFQNMENDNDFAEGISKAIKDYAEEGKVITTDKGTVSAGAFIGGGEGSISLTDSIMSSPIKVACVSMGALIVGGDEILATAITSGLTAMILASEVETNVNGSVTNPSGVVSPLVGKAKGKLVCNIGEFAVKLLAVFTAMKVKYKDEGFDGNSYFAEQLADMVDSLIKNGVVNTSGEDVLEGSVGVGSIT